ncbi:MAG: UvrD-helicase domain-containing protein [Oscillospiraceae bacterium]|nr:UvrD-helicase domain-containing protein [Oscillospiraceae bacterium]
MLIADLHIHSKYARSTSQDCVPEVLDLWARKKGIALVGTGDFTHPGWRTELRDKLLPAEDGLYTLRPDARQGAGGAADTLYTRFVVSGEISSIYKKDGKVRKVHNLILLPGLEEAERLSRRLEAIGNLHSDGRPILGLDCRDLLEITLECCPQAVLIPAHIWTPHFSLFGAFSGFDSIEECFGDMTPYIHALETGLSSDPPMNWRLSALDGYTLVSNSDAHSPAKLGREANLLDIPPSYAALSAAIQEGTGFQGTVEFFPEEGKYHYDGHRRCAQCLSPLQAEEAQNICPVCGKRLTTGVLHRVEQLADRPEGFILPDAKPFQSLVPLPEVIAASVGGGPDSVKNLAKYEALLHTLGPEFYILRQAPLEDVRQVAGPCVAEGLRRLRAGEVDRSPGYDGAYGTIGLLSPAERENLNGQVSLFGLDVPVKRRKAAGQSFHQASQRSIEPEERPMLPDEAQQAAAAAPGKVVAVIAGPGTGKTHTLVERVIWLLEQGARPGEITAVTFTSRAAGALRTRLSGALDSKTAKAMTIGTFHGICLSLLQREGVPVRLVGESEALELAASVLRGLECKTHPRRLLQQIAQRKNGVPSEEELPIEAEERYNTQLKQAGLWDFDDLLLEVLNRWPDGHPPRKRGFTHLLVDEFQDSSPLQVRLVEAWSRSGKSLFAIGDPDQAIYSFRGADGACFSKLITEQEAQVCRLTQNYRSTPEILRCALSVIGANPGPERVLIPHGASGPLVRLLRAESDRTEAIFVAKEINRMVGGVDMLEAGRYGAERAQMRDFSAFAVCYRTRRQAALLEQCLGREGIPCVIAGRDDCLADRTVRGALAFFRLLLDPESPDALGTCLHLLWDCPETLIQQAQAAWTAQDGTAEMRASSVSAALGQGPLKPWEGLVAAFAPKAGAAAPDKLLEEWSRQARCTGSEALERLRNMAVFHRTMGEFLQTIALGREGDLLRRSGRDYAAGAVTLSTFHAAKGLEFPVVFLCGLKQGLVPLNGRGPAEQAILEEERRLFYVAITRAREELILLTSGEPSPFLDSLPQDALESGTAAQVRQPGRQDQISLF